MKKVLMTLLTIVVIVVAGGYGTVSYMNREHDLNLFEYFQTQDMTPEGQTAVFIIGLSQTEDFDPTWWYNIFQHLAHARIPWPARNFALADRGVALMDPDRDYSTEKFEPASLVDRHGKSRDMDAVPYIEKFQHGEIQWVEPTESIHLDTGYWLYTGRQDGVPTVSGKTINYARLWYYGRGITGGQIPADWQQNRIYDIVYEKLQSAYPDIPHHQADTMDPYTWRKEIFELLDGGAETLVLISPMVVYSDFEDFKNGFLHSVEYVHEWETLNGREIKIIIAPPMGHFQPMRDGYLLMLRDRLDTLPAGVSVKMVWSVHGMPWRVFTNEAWLELIPAYRDLLVEETHQLLDEYAFSETEVVVSQDHFADHYWDPEEKYLSTNRAYVEGVEAGYDYVLNLPIEFYNENTDTLFYHAMVNYENFPGYTVYDVIDYPKEYWDEPYTKHFVIDDTEIYYLGVPTGSRYRPYIAQAMYDSLKSVLSKGSTGGRVAATGGQP